MADLNLDGTNLVLTGQTETVESPQRTLISSYWDDRFSRAALKNKYESTGSSTVMEVQSRIKSLSESLGKFRWSDDGFGLNDARLVVNDPFLDNKISASVTPKNEFARYYRTYSRGFTGGSRTSLDPGIYKFDMSYGSATKELNITVESGMDNDAVLEAVRDAVNESTLPVQARKFTQNVPGANLDDLLGVGSSLAFSVNTAYSNNNSNIVGGYDGSTESEINSQLSFSDTSGHLISHLKLDGTLLPIGSAKEGRYDLSGTMAGSVSEFVSKGFDVNAVSTLAIGSHSIGYSIGEESGTLDFSVEEGDTWEVVLGSIQSAAGGTSEKITAEVIDTKLPSPVYTGDDYYLIDGKAVSITAVSPKLGERLVLEPDAGLEVLGLNVTSQPGTDSVMVVNGVSETRAPGEFALDHGRVIVELEESFGDTLPLRVVDAVSQMEENIGSFTDAYNDLRKTILPSEDLFREGFADMWRKPIDDNRVDYEWMGLREAEKDKVLWFDSDVFYSAIGAEPEKVRDLLDGVENGLVPLWEEINENVLKNKVSTYLIPETSLPGPWLPEPSPRTELELEQKRELVDTFDTALSFDFDKMPESTGRLISRKG
ncbi:hypothetical protein SAMN05660337_0289 [Maridesulfovibrio ferrireducens]|uniref:Uncharacterized protein n=1 Tax=Maridesulfovibrio ferrireducens TaxID=246191 RepID=A0A1G9BGT0_9BACT|nr:hypothetical protein [Maridesulfovibrio ferrireducens]SDK38726.1 hypothetical protein SAMN05660337_0289 [Maridesulfovibrio ferrireducens]